MLILSIVQRRLPQGGPLTYLLTDTASGSVALLQHIYKSRRKLDLHYAIDFEGLVLAEVEVGLLTPDEIVPYWPLGLYLDDLHLTVV